MLRENKRWWHRFTQKDPLGAEKLCYDDVSIRPQFSRVKSRKETDLSQNLSSNLYLNLPIISANMKTVTGSKMAAKVSKFGGLSLLHRFCTAEENRRMWDETIAAGGSWCRVGCSLGLGPEELKRVKILRAAGCNIWCIDVAHGANQEVVNQATSLRKIVGPSETIIVGCFATKDSIYAFEKAYGSKHKLPDLYRVGISNGSICVTAKKTGVGVPQFSAVLECAREFPVIADGGCRTPGDIAKALGAGAEAVMIGGMLAGTQEAEGSRDGWYVYEGSAATGYAQGHKTSEGVEFKVEGSKGPVDLILKDIEGGLRSSLSYSNAFRLDEFRKNVKFDRVSTNSVVEAGAHYSKIANQ